MKLDNTDLRILAMLQQQPDLTMEALGQLVGLSHTPCWRRVQRLEKNHILHRKAVMIDRQALKLDIIVYGHVKLQGHDGSKLDDFEAEIQAIPDVLECYSLAGDFDYLLKIVTQDIDRYERILKRRILQLPHVASISSHFALREVKATHMLPIPTTS